MSDSMNVDSSDMNISHTPPSFCGSQELKKPRFHSPMVQNAYEASPARQFNTVSLQSQVTDTRSYDTPLACADEREKRLSNSTSSIFASSTLTNPDANQIILCLSAVLKIQMDHDREVPPELRSKFSKFEVKGDGEWAAEESAPLNCNYLYTGESVDHIYSYIDRIFTMARFSPECCIIALVYLNRVISDAGMPLHPSNWRPLVLASLILAQKVWDDKSLATSAFAKIIPIYSKKQIQDFERYFVELLQYQAIVKQSLYARYYFELRELFEQLMRERIEDPNQPFPSFPIQPLKIWKAQQLEIYSSSFQLQPSSASQQRGQTSQQNNVMLTPSQTLEDATYIPKGRFVHS